MDFKISCSIRAAGDSADWATMTGAVLVHVTPESLTCRRSRPDDQKLHREPLARPAAAVPDSIDQVVVWVVVGRQTRVKATDPATGPAITLGRHERLDAGSARRAPAEVVWSRPSDATGGAMRNRSTRWVECGMRVRAVLLEDWDPVGVAGRSEMRDEYDGYALRIVGLLVRRAPQQALFDFLWKTETAHMGLPGNRERTERVAARLMGIPADVERDLGA